jgi:enamine deaminase RidA (YjgF/YER057c/UK114 family)
MAHKAEMDRAWGEWVAPANAPQRACLGVALEGNTLVEIAVTAAAG